MITRTSLIPTGMKALAATVVATLALSATASAAPLPNCFNLTAATSIPASSIAKRIPGLTVDQKKELRSRLTIYNTNRWPGYTDMGLTAEQIAAIDAEIARYTASLKPLGYPCSPLKNQAKTIAFVKDTLVYNGFRPAMRVISRQPRQVQIEAVRDGWRYFVVVARTGTRQVGLVFHSTTRTPPVSPVRLKTTFVP